MTMRRRFLGLAALALVSCAEQPDDPAGQLPVQPNQIPPVPVDLTVEVAQDQVTLRWNVADATGVTGYRVWRAIGNSSFESIGTPPITRFTDDQVVSGTRYRYQVSAMRAGLEGARSATVSATPALFSIVLEGGAEITGGNAIIPGSRKIVVSLVAPDSTNAYRLSEDSTFTGAPYQGFDAAAPSAIFTLSPGDGLKRVFARFQDNGGASSGLVQETIRLDTKAVISDVTEDSNGATLGVNDVLHVRVDVDTTGGIASVDIGTAYEDVQAFDDGTNGDAVAFDGNYERDITISAGIEAVNAVVVGSFTDQVGNTADALGSSTRVTIAEPPDQVLFDEAASRVLGAGVQLRWFRCDADDFARYRIFRSPAGAGGVDTDDTLIADITARDSLSISDTGLSGNTRYTWGILAVDTNGFASPLDPLTRTVAFDPVLLNPVVTPAFGSPSTVFEYTCMYRHAGNVAPVFVSVIVDGNQTFAMTKVGSGTNWVAGESFRATASLPAGGHTYFFRTDAVDGSSARNPTSTGLVLGGPSVSP